jgi:hypothetical protein
MTHTRASDRTLRDPTHSDGRAPLPEGCEKPHAGENLGTTGHAVRGLGSRMRRDDIPEQNVLDHPEPGKYPVHDGRTRFSRACASELPLGREGNSRDAGAPAAGRLADEQRRRS